MPQKTILPERSGFIDRLNGFFWWGIDDDPVCALYGHLAGSERISTIVVAVPAIDHDGGFSVFEDPFIRVQARDDRLTGAICLGGGFGEDVAFDRSGPPDRRP